MIFGGRSEVVPERVFEPTWNVVTVLGISKIFPVNLVLLFPTFVLNVTRLGGKFFTSPESVLLDVF